MAWTAVIDRLCIVFQLKVKAFLELDQWAAITIVVFNLNERSLTQSKTFPETERVSFHRKVVVLSDNSVKAHTQPGDPVGGETSRSLPTQGTSIFTSNRMNHDIEYHCMYSVHTLYTTSIQSVSNFDHKYTSCDMIAQYAMYTCDQAPLVYS